MKAEAITFSILAILCMLIAIVPVDAQQNLYVLALDPYGRPRAGVEINVVGEGYSRVFITNSTGYATFRDLPPGTYTVKANIRGVTVSEKTIIFPLEQHVNLRLSISSLGIRVLDLKNNSVSNLRVYIRSDSGIVSLSASTDEFGAVKFYDLPNSNITNVGSYLIETYMDNLVIDRRSITLLKDMYVEIVTKLINVNITVLDAEGRKLQGFKVTIRSGNFSKSISDTQGLASFKQIPSSDITPIPYYVMEVTRSIVGKDVVIYRENRSITSDISLDLVASIGNIKIKVQDPEGNPLQGVGVIVGTAYLGNFSMLTTDKDGVAIAKNLPYSTYLGAMGDYVLTIVRAKSVLDKITLTLDKPILEYVYTMKPLSITLYIRDYNGDIVKNLTVKLMDLHSERELSYHADEGTLSLKLLPGSYKLDIWYRGSNIYSKRFDAKEGDMEIKLHNVNYPIKIKVIDSFGNLVTNVNIKALFNDVPIEINLDRGVASLNLPYPGSLAIYVYTNGELLQKRTFMLNGPDELTIRLSDKVLLLGSLIDLSIVTLAISLAFLAIALSLLILVVIKRAIRRS